MKGVIPKKIKYIPIHGRHALSGGRAVWEGGRGMKAILYTYKGKTQSVTAWAKEYHMSSGTLNERLKRGWPIEQALTESVADNLIFYEYNGRQYTAAELAAMHGNINVTTMRTRLKTMTVEEALALPNRHPTRRVQITEEQQKRMFKPRPHKPDTKQCRTCIYHGSLSGCGGGDFGTVYCDYIEIKLKRRPCPPPPHCTEYKQGRSLVRSTALKRMGKVRA